jgi:hypothetical protein
MSEEQDEHLHTERDGETQKVLGLFMGALAIPVIIGTLWSETFVQGTVCFISGVILLGFGIGFWLKGKHTLSKLK